MKILYLQMRKDKETADEEFAEFKRFSGIPAEQFNVLNVFKTPVFDCTTLDTHDALFIGGSSDDPEDTTYLDPALYPYITSCEQLIQYAYDTKTPTLASCMGFEIAIDVLGGEMIVDKEHMEIGTYTITLTDDGTTDPLFTNTPAKFTAVSGHKKRAKTLPPGAILLAYSELCPIHGFTFPDRPFYAFQFHPEIDVPDLTARLRRYITRGYVSDTQELAGLMTTFEPTPHANALVKHFVDTFLTSS